MLEILCKSDLFSLLTCNRKLLAALNYTKKLKPGKANGMPTLALDLLNYQHFLGLTISHQQSKYLLMWKEVSLLRMFILIITAEQS